MSYAASKERDTSAWSSLKNGRRRRFEGFVIEALPTLTNTSSLIQLPYYKQEAKTASGQL